MSAHIYRVHFRHAGTVGVTTDVKVVATDNVDAARSARAWLDAQTPYVPWVVESVKLDEI